MRSHARLTYDQVAELGTGETVFLDVAGNTAVRRAVHERLGADLVHSAVIGAAHHTAAPDDGGRLPGARPTFFFAPDQMRKRYAEWSGIFGKIARETGLKPQ